MIDDQVLTAARRRLDLAKTEYQDATVHLETVMARVEPTSLGGTPQPMRRVEGSTSLQPRPLGQ